MQLELYLLDKYFLKPYSFELKEKIFCSQFSGKENRLLYVRLISCLFICLSTHTYIIITILNTIQFFRHLFGGHLFSDFLVHIDVEEH